MKFLDSDFNQEHEDIIELIGVDNYVKLLKLRGGMLVYFPKYEAVTREVRNRDIVKRYNGVNAQSLAKEYRITESYVKKILKREGVL